MTTSHSPLRVLKEQADKIAAMVKAIDRGEPVAGDPQGKVAASRAKGVFTFGVVMDDKFLKIEMTWATIRATSEVALSEWILKQMRDSRDTQH